MNARQQMLLFSIGIMAGVALLVVAVSITILYRTGFEGQRERLVATAQSQARLLEAVARFNAQRSQENQPNGAAAATLSQMIDAHSRYAGFGKTGEFTLARRDGNRIVFLLSHRHAHSANPDPVAWNSRLAEPMRRALRGLSGTIVGLDYRGETVLAAYEPVAELEHGIVAKIDLAEIRTPFVTAGAITGCAALLVIAIGAGLVLRGVDPLFRRLEESEIRNKTILDSAADGIITIDERGVIESFNAAAEKIFGYPKHEALGKNINILMPASYQEEHDAYLEKYIDTGVSKLIGFQREVVGQRKDGAVFPMDLHVSEVRLHGQRLFTGIMRDVTERKQASEEISPQARFLNAAIESLDHSFLVIDAEDYSVRMANAFARRNAPHGARTCYAISHDRSTPCDSTDDPCPLSEVKRTGEPMRVEHVHYAGDGSRRNIEVHACPVFDEDKRVVQIIEYSLDITERKRAEQQLREAKEAAESVSESLRETVEELETFNQLAVGRELRMIELKQEVNELLVARGREPKFDIVEAEEVIS